MSDNKYGSTPVGIACNTFGSFTGNEHFGGNYPCGIYFEDPKIMEELKKEFSDLNDEFFNSGGKAKKQRVLNEFKPKYREDDPFEEYLLLQKKADFGRPTVYDTTGKQVTDLPAYLPDGSKIRLFWSAYKQDHATHGRGANFTLTGIQIVDLGEIRGGIDAVEGGTFTADDVPAPTTTNTSSSDKLDDEIPF